MMKCIHLSTFYPLLVVAHPAVIMAAASLTSAVRCCGGVLQAAPVTSRRNSSSTPTLRIGSCGGVFSGQRVVPDNFIWRGGQGVQLATEPSAKSLEVMRKFSEQYARRSGTYFCVDKSVTAVVIKGLAAHKDTLGAPLCPCRNYDDKVAEAQQGYWNCPCVPMRERKECHCMLFLTPDNDFVGEEQAITMEEIDQVQL
eukprot:TRINITY_DN20941_c0_g1_i1.p1 TRINITY_DN20941_c0_g1~~TRINITY_DN20941_c0_g1_i1.p1  ORF type:complete len:198 (-),score=17.34 TRINITY_DN20941_c0_g1_i1:440-1033(-)